MKMLTSLLVLFVLSRVMAWVLCPKVLPAVPISQYRVLGVEEGRFAAIRSSALFIFWRSVTTVSSSGMLPPSATASLPAA
jgi:hypothetical protein